MKTHEKLAQMRKDAKLSRRELAEISGFNEHTILAYERNQNPAKYDYIKFCVLYFGYTMDSIQDDAKELEKANEIALTMCRYFDIYPDEIRKFLNFVDDLTIKGLIGKKDKFEKPKPYIVTIELDSGRFYTFLVLYIS